MMRRRNPRKKSTRYDIMYRFASLQCQTREGKGSSEVISMQRLKSQRRTRVAGCSRGTSYAGRSKEAKEIKAKGQYPRKGSHEANRHRGMNDKRRRKRKRERRRGQKLLKNTLVLSSTVASSLSLFWQWASSTAASREGEVASRDWEGDNSAA